MLCGDFEVGFLFGVNVVHHDVRGTLKDEKILMIEDIADVLSEIQ